MHYGDPETLGAGRTREYRKRLASKGVKSVHLHYWNETMLVLKNLCDQYDLNMNQVVNALILGRITPYPQIDGGCDNEFLAKMKKRLPIGEKKNRLIQSRTLAEWARFTGIKYATLQKRLDNGWSIEDALLTPVGQRTNRISKKGGAA